MSTLVITGVTDGKKIQAIKGLRTVTGWSLKETKDAIDHVYAGGEYSIQEHPGFEINSKMLQTLQEHEIVCRIKGGHVVLGDLVGILRRFDPDCTIGALLDVLAPVQTMLGTNELTP